MNRRVWLCVVMAAGLLCLSVVPTSRAEDLVEDTLGEDVDVEDELDLDLAGDEEDLEADLQDEAPPTLKAPPTPKVRLRGIGLPV